MNSSPVYLRRARVHCWYSYTKYAEGKLLQKIHFLNRSDQLLAVSDASLSSEVRNRMRLVSVKSALEDARQECSLTGHRCGWRPRINVQMLDWLFEVENYVAGPVSGRWEKTFGHAGFDTLLVDLVWAPSWKLGRSWSQQILGDRRKKDVHLRDSITLW